MIIQDKIFLRKKRDFGDLFGTVFGLIRRNFGVLFGSILLVAGPFVILTSVVTAILQASVLRSFRDLGTNLLTGGILQNLSDALADSFGWMLLIWFFALLSFAFLRTTVASFFVIYESKAEGDSFTINEIARKTYRDVWKVLGGIVVFSLVAIPITALLLIPFVLLAAFGGVAGKIIMVFIMLFGLLAFTPQLIYIFQFAPYFVMVRDKVFVFEALKRTFKTIKGNFWWIWVLMICIGIIVLILGGITSLPATIYQKASTFSRYDAEAMVESYSSPVYIALYVFGMLCTNIIHALGDLMVGVSYYSFEEEKTGQGLALKIDEIGKAEDNPNFN